MTPEARLIAAIVRRLRKRKLEGEPLWWVKTHGSPMQRAGVPDLLICHRGRFVAVEAKTGANAPTRLQMHQIGQMVRAKAVVRVMRDADEIDALLDEVRVHDDRCDSLWDAVAAASLDIAPCIECGQTVACIPDGLPMCAKCGEAAKAKEGE